MTFLNLIRSRYFDFSGSRRVHPMLVVIGFSLIGSESFAGSLPPGYTFTTFAGTPYGPGAIDSNGKAARFCYPEAVAISRSGCIYVADSVNNTIRKITPAGSVTTLAGLARSGGSADGRGSSARFNWPEGVTVDNSENVYVSDSGNNTIRKVTPSGIVTTFAGQAGICGSADGIGSTATFCWPRGLAADKVGNIYVADMSNSTIRKITPEGAVTTLAGQPGCWGSNDGEGSAAKFVWPQDLAVDDVGNVYVADGRFDNTIRKITPAGFVTTVELKNANGTAVGFRSLNDVEVDSAGTLYVSFGNSRVICRVTPTGEVTKYAGLEDMGGNADGAENRATFGHPWGLALDDTGNLYVADQLNSTIRKVTPERVVTTVAGTASGANQSVDGTKTSARFNAPTAAALDIRGNLFVTDIGNHTIRKITPAGVVTTWAGSAGKDGSTDGVGSAARFNTPLGVAVNTEGVVYVSDSYNHTIRKITPTQKVTTLAGLAGSPGSSDGTGPSARFSYPCGVAVDSFGMVYVTDRYNGTVRVVTPTGKVSTLAGVAGGAESVDGPAKSARFSSLFGIAVDSRRNVYVSDNCAIRKISPEGLVTTLAGVSGLQGTSDGIGRVARFDYAEGIALDCLNNIYVADNQNCTIRKLTPGGSVTTLAGIAGDAGYTDGTGSTARFAFPSGVVVDKEGNIYVVDQWNNVIRKGTAACEDRPLIDLDHASVGKKRQLDTYPRTANRWFWRMIRRPANSSARLSSNWVRNPSFTPDVPDLYVFELRATNAAGRISIANVKLLAGIPPTIVAHPIEQTVSSGGSVAFSVEAAGDGPFRYQWRRNATNLNGATDSVLVLNNVAEAGNYSVVVSSPFGKISSSNAVLQVQANLQ